MTSSSEREPDPLSWDRWSLLRPWARKRYDRYFEAATGVHIFRGVFDSFDAAQASAPASKPVSYDNTASAELYLQRLRLDAHDYPALFWVGRSFDEGLRRVFDIGGSIGIKYYAFSRLLAFPADVRWTVEDMPEVAKRGQRFVQEQAGELGYPAAASQLAFADRIEAGDGCELLFCSGSLQYLPLTLGRILAGYAVKPRRIVVNTTPIHATRSFFTLNNIGTAFCSYRIQAHADFVREVRSAGYTLRDHWQNLGKGMSIPFEPECEVPAYSGFCFDRSA